MRAKRNGTKCQVRIFKIIASVCLLLVFLFVKNDTSAQNLEDIVEKSTTPFDVGLEQHLGQKVDMTIPFTDEDGNQTNLGEIANGKPILLMLVYYNCPGICSPLMNGVSDAAVRMNLDSGRDFTLVSISFSPEEDHELAKAKKINYLEAANNKIPSDGWRFLTGTQKSIDAITRQVGFKYMESPEQQNEWTDYVHTGVLTALSPDGSIARYLLPVGPSANGSQNPQAFLPFDLKMAVLEASEGRTGPTVSRVLQFCFSYDPVGRTYTFNILRVTATVCLLVIGFFGIFLYVTTKHYRKLQMEKIKEAKVNTSKEVINHG